MQISTDSREALKGALRSILPRIQYFTKTPVVYLDPDLPFPNWLLHVHPVASLINFIWPFEPDFDVFCWNGRCTTWAWSRTGVLPSRLWVMTFVDDSIWHVVDFWASDSGALVLLKLCGLLALFLVLFFIMVWLLGLLLRLAHFLGSTQLRQLWSLLRVLFWARWQIAVSFVLNSLRVYVAGRPLPLVSDVFLVLLFSVFKENILATIAGIYAKLKALLSSAWEDVDSSTPDNVSAPPETSNNSVGLSQSNKATTSSRENRYEYNIQASIPRAATSSYNAYHNPNRTGSNSTCRVNEDDMPDRRPQPPPKDFKPLPKDPRPASRTIPRKPVGSGNARAASDEIRRRVRADEHTPAKPSSSSLPERSTSNDASDVSEPEVQLKRRNAVRQSGLYDLYSGTNVAHPDGPGKQAEKSEGESSANQMSEALNSAARPQTSDHQIPRKPVPQKQRSAEPDSQAEPSRPSKPQSQQYANQVPRETDPAESAADQASSKATTRPQSFMSPATRKRNAHAQPSEPGKAKSEPSASRPRSRQSTSQAPPLPASISRSSTQIPAEQAPPKAGAHEQTPAAGQPKGDPSIPHPRAEPSASDAPPSSQQPQTKPSTKTNPPSDTKYNSNSPRPFHEFDFETRYKPYRPADSKADDPGATPAPNSTNQQSGAAYTKVPYQKPTYAGAAPHQRSTDSAPQNPHPQPQQQQQHHRRRSSNRKPPTPSPSTSQRQGSRPLLHDLTSSAPDSFDPYAILGVAPTASPQEIRKAYRKQTLFYHPDKAANNNLTPGEAKEATAALNRAKEVLGEFAPRLVYHVYGMRGLGSQMVLRWGEELVRGWEEDGVVVEKLFGEGSIPVERGKWELRWTGERGAR
jgi:hypothetical protein